MSKIEKVKNVSIYSDLTASACNWNQTLNLGFSPDEVYVRQITYLGPADKDGAYLVWCSLHSDFIGSFALHEDVTLGSLSVNVTPNTLIKCSPNSFPSNLQFQLYSINGSSVPVSSSVLTGTIIMNLDFVKYS